MNLIQQVNNVYWRREKGISHHIKSWHFFWIKSWTTHAFLHFVFILFGKRGNSYMSNREDIPFQIIQNTHRLQWAAESWTTDSLWCIAIPNGIKNIIKFKQINRCFMNELRIQLTSFRFFHCSPIFLVYSVAMNN